MDDTDRILMVLDGWANHGRDVIAELVRADGPDAEPAAFRAVAKVFFHAGVAAGLSDLGERVLAGLDTALSPIDIQDSVDELRRALTIELV